MALPLIGIPMFSTPNERRKRSDFAAHSTYSRALDLNGGLPVCIPLDLSEQHLRAIYGKLDGLLLAGGVDVHPKEYGEGVERFISFAAEHGIHPAQLAIAWVRYSPAVTSPIVGVSSLSQLQTSVGAFDFDLTATEYEEVTYMFDTAVKEEGFQRFPGLRNNFPRLRRNLDLIRR